jgi:nickel/cobalt transporter (NicO) family protein
VLLAALILPMMVARAADPFQSGRPSSSTVAISLPAWMAGPIAAVAKLQRDLNEAISSRIREVNETHSRRSLAIILLLSFAFGIFHAVGPGHGKMVVASYLMARRERLVDGIIVGSLISLVQGLSAIAMVGVLALVLQLGQLELFGKTTLVEAVSYALIALIGLRMLHQAITGKSHDHHHSHEAAPGEGDTSSPQPRHRYASMFGLAFAAGLVPCASAIIVMLFALANHALLIGIEAAIAMSLGMAITVSLIGVASVVARQLMVRIVTGHSHGSVALDRGLNVSASLLLVAFASLLFLGAVSRL